MKQFGAVIWWRSMEEHSEQLACPHRETFHCGCWPGVTVNGWSTTCSVVKTHPWREQSGVSLGWVVAPCTCIRECFQYIFKREICSKITRLRDTWSRGPCHFSRWWLITWLSEPNNMNNCPSLPPNQVISLTWSSKLIIWLSNAHEASVYLLRLWP